MTPRKTAAFCRVGTGLGCRLAWSLLALAACGDEITVLDGGDPPTPMSVTVSNVEDGGVLHSGFLLGALEGA